MADEVQIGQVAPEIVYTKTDAPVQVAQAAPEIVYTKTDAPIQIAQVAQEIIYAQESKFWLAIFRLLDQ